MSDRKPVLPTLELIARYGPGRRLELASESVTIGKDPRSDIRLDDNTVSWRHARVFRGADGGFFLEDLCTRGGTLVDGEQVVSGSEPVPLRDGSRIRICGDVLIFHA